MLLCRDVFSLRSDQVHTSTETPGRAYQEKKIGSTLPGYVRMYDIRDAKGMWRPSWRRNCFSLRPGGGTLGIIKSPVCSCDLKFNRGPLFASHNLMYFSLS